MRGGESDSLCVFLYKCPNALFGIFIFPGEACGRKHLLVAHVLILGGWFGKPGAEIEWVCRSIEGMEVGEVKRSREVFQSRGKEVFIHAPLEKGRRSVCRTSTCF